MFLNRLEQDESRWCSCHTQAKSFAYHVGCMCGVLERLKHVWKDETISKCKAFQAELGDLRLSSTWNKRSYTCGYFCFVQVLCQMPSYISYMLRLLCSLCIGYAFDTPAWTRWCGLISGLCTYFFPIMGASSISGAKAALELQGLSGIFFLWSCCELLTYWLQLSLAAVGAVS